MSAVAPAQVVLAPVAEFVSERTGLAFPANRRRPLARAVERAMRRTGARTPHDLCDVLASDESALEDLIADVTVGETYFFRDLPQFERIRDLVVPEVMARRPPEHVFRAWSAGCASGEEAYSIAMLLHDAGLGNRAQVLATDISVPALLRAREARYRDWSLRGPGAEVAQRHLRHDGATVSVAPHIRDMVRFEWLNLASDAFPSLVNGTWDLDLVVCRNVLVYLTPEVAVRIGGALFDCLAEGGWLFTAPSDPGPGIDTEWCTVMTGAGIAHRRPPADATAHGLHQVPAPAPAADAVLHAEGDSESPVGKHGGEHAHPIQAPAPRHPLQAAGGAFRRGDYRRAAALAATAPEDLSACLLHVRALANVDLAAAAEAAAQHTRRHVLAPALHYLHAVVLVGLDRDEEAKAALRRVLYLDRSLAAAHFTLGSLLERCGDASGAARAYRSTRELCLAAPADAPVPLGDGEPAGRLARAATVALALLPHAEARP